MELQVGVDQGVQQRPVLGPQGALLGQQVGQGLARRGGPGGEGQDELVAGDQAVLQGEQAEEQVARGVVTSWHRGGSRPGRGDHGCTPPRSALGDQQAEYDDKRDPAGN